MIIFTVSHACKLPSLMQIALTPAPEKKTITTNPVSHATGMSPAAVVSYTTGLAH